VKKPPINKTSNWPALDKARKALEDGATVPPSTFAAIADRLQVAIDAPDAARIQTAATMLEAFYRDVVSTATSAVQGASRGVDNGDLAISYALGKFSFAQLLAARIADRRADQRFVDHISDARYLPYVQALATEPLSVSALREKTGERLETASRKLGALRALGIVVSRKHGNVVVNMLTPAASATLDMLGLSRSDLSAPVAKTADARQTLDGKREALQSHMRETPPFVGRPGARRAEAA
jgi:DNA-binding transcriptional ArsR family regulator